MSEVLKQKIRKDLSRWSRKLLLSIGLEDIGKHLVGEEKWKSLYPWQGKDDDQTPDFDPSEVPEEPDIPDAANSDVLSQVDPSESPEEEPGEEKNESLENFFHLLPYWCFINRAFGNSGLSAGLGNVSEEDLSSGSIPLLDALDVNQRLNSLLFLESLKQQYVQAGAQSGLQNSFNHFQNLPMYNPELLEQARLAVSSHTPKLDPKHEALQQGLFCLASNSCEDLDQPLDLTQKTRSNATEPSSDSRRNWSEVSSSNIRPLPVDDLKLLKTSPRLTVRSGKGYTSQELEAALRDIQSGKLGTRRAAVIYGIPRSTLRNKVYKMGKDRSRPYLRQKGLGDKSEDGLRESTPMSDLNFAEKLSSATEDSKLKETLSAGRIRLPHTNFSAKSIPGSHSQGVSASDVLRLQISDENDDEDGPGVQSEEEISHEKKVLKEWLRTKLSKQSSPDQHSVSLLPTVEIKASLNHNLHMESLSDSSDNSDVSPQDSRKDVILKIPSVLGNKSSLSRVISRRKLKRKSSRDDDGNQDAADSTLSITNCYMDNLPSSSTANSELTRANQFRWKDTRLGRDDNEGLEDSLSDSKSLLSSSLKQDPYQQWGYGKETSVSSMSSTNNSASLAAMDANGKKSRPKRGKYRNYDRDALLQAVRAVQNGEMSVHRAGSFYGVPHSTLEYKVKERHLLRRPKRKGNDSPKPSHKSSPESSVSGSDQLSARTSLVSHLVEKSSCNMPITADLRESLSRYLNVNPSAGLGPLAGSPLDLPSNTNSRHAGVGKGMEDAAAIENHSNVGLSRGISPYLNLFNLNDLIRQNLEGNSLLDLTKKS